MPLVSWAQVFSHLAILIAAVLTALLTHFLLYKPFQKGSRKPGSVGAKAIVQYTSGSMRALFVLVAFSIAIPSPDLSVWLAGPVQHVLEIGYIVVLAWLACGIVEVLSALIRHHLPENLQEDVRARRVRTQVHLIRRIVIGVILFGALAAVLMTFPHIRSIGAGLFASAGLAGLALGMAARPTLGNLIAGVQVALTEPIRIGDEVVVEGEWGRVWEVNTTYVIIRLWDLRHQVVPLSYFIEQPFQNWTRYSSELVGAVLIYVDYSAPIDQLREEYARILESSPLWDRKVNTVQVTEAREHTIELRFLLSASNATATFNLRCHVREKMIEYLQKQHSYALPMVRLLERPVSRPSAITPEGN